VLGAGELEWHHAADGTRLCIHRWVATGRTQGHVLVVHGYADHAGRYAELASYLASSGFAVVAPDLRGHGRSEGRRGHLRNFEEYHADLATGWALLPATSPRFVVAHSMGALVALDYLTLGAKNHDLQLPSATVVTSPFLALAIAPPVFKLLLGRIAARVLPGLTLANGLVPEMLTRDATLAEAHCTDPLVFRTATAGWFAATELAQQRVRELRRFPTPLLYVYSDADPVALPAANSRLAAQLAGPATQVIVRAADRHEVLNEIDRRELFDRILGFFEETGGAD